MLKTDKQNQNQAQHLTAEFSQVGIGHELATEVAQITICVKRKSVQSVHPTLKALCCCGSISNANIRKCLRRLDLSRPWNFSSFRLSASTDDRLFVKQLVDMNTVVALPSELLVQRFYQIQALLRQLSKHGRAMVLVRRKG